MKFKNYIFFTLITLVIVDSFRWISYVGALEIDSATYISVVLVLVSIYFLIQMALKSNWEKESPKAIRNIIKLWILINSINIFVSVFLAKGYWDFKFLLLEAVPFTLVCMAFFIGNNLQKSIVVFKFVLKYLFPFGFFLIPLTLVTNEELYSRIMIPISLFILFIPFLKFKLRVLIVLVTITSVLLVVGFRSNIIKISFSLLLLLAYYLNLNKIWLRTINFSLFVVPIVLFFLAFSGVFNVFQDLSNSKDLQITTNQITGETLGGDSRTFLYVEVLNSINKKGNFLIGSGMCEGYESFVVDVSNGTYNNKRYRSEVGILNILMQSGLIGIFVYFLLLFKVTFLAINHSSNRLAKVLGLYVSFRWMFSFIEEFTQYDLNFYFFWLTIGLISSNKFRAMTDKEMKNWFRNIFMSSRTIPKLMYR